MNPHYGPQQPQPQPQPAKTSPAPVIIGVSLAAVAVLAVGGCLGAVASTGSDAPTSSTTPATTADDGELDEWTEMVFEITWDDMSPRERDELCEEVETLGADTAAQVIDRETSADADLDRHTIEQILTDYCA